MKRNVGIGDRVFRLLAASAMGSCAAMAPLPLAVRLATFGTAGTYLLFTAVVGSCLGYRVMGKSTCRVDVAR